MYHSIRSDGCFEIQNKIEYWLAVKLINSLSNFSVHQRAVTAASLPIGCVKYHFGDNLHDTFILLKNLCRWVFYSSSFKNRLIAVTPQNTKN